MAADKASLRALLRARRAAIPADELAAKSAAITGHVLADPRWREALAIAAFVGTHVEPDTTALLDDALSHGKELWLPRVLDARAGLSELVRIRDRGVLVPGPLGILQPGPDAGPGVPAIAPSLEMDLVLVPGLAFGRDGARLGHGPGHYDRLLAPIAALDRPWRIGVCVAELLDPVEDPLPTESHDVAMHLVVTEDGVVACRRRDPVPHVIEPASSGRAKCRACGKPIDKGALRFGERADNPYGEGLATWWFHLPCAAMRRPEPLLALLDSADLELSAAPTLQAWARAGVEHPRRARIAAAQRDPSGRARCRHCREAIGKDTWRIVLTMWDDGRFSPMGFVHAACARQYFGAADPDDLLARLQHASPDLSPDDRAELARALAA